MTNAQQIEELAKQGYTVRIAHERPIAGVSIQPGLHGEMVVIGNESGEPVMCNRFLLDKDWPGYRHNQRGGITYVRIYRGDSRGVAPAVESYAACSMRDNYNKRLGVAIALGRAISVLKAIDAVPEPVQ